MTLAEVRAYRQTDWDDVWPIVSEVISRQDTFTYDPAMSEADARLTWTGSDGTSRTTVAVVDGAVSGTARMGVNRPGPGSHVATASFMVARSARGRGIGTLLIRDATAWARHHGFAGIQFNAVAASNVSAVELYEREGFTIVGTVPGAFLHPTQGRVGLHIMYLDLSTNTEPLA